MSQLPSVANRSARTACLAALSLLVLLPTLARGQADPTSRSWNQPVEPYRIAGNLYYVGASDVTSFLIATPEGHVLLDGGFVETVPIIRDSVRKLGFRLEDVKVLISSHAHYDHAGGLAELKRLTGAKLAASEADAPALARGGTGDPALGDQFPFPPVAVDRTLRDGDTVSLGGTTLTARLTPGHTPGCTTWTMKVAEGERTYDVVFVGSATVLPGVRLTGRPTYPGIADDFATAFRVWKSLPCDIFLASHGSFYGATEKAARLAGKADANPFVDPQGYRAWLERVEGVYVERLAREKAEAAAPGKPGRSGGAPESSP